jgi:hypothetical protein
MSSGVGKDRRRVPSAEADTDERFLRRWARHKQEARTEAERMPAAAPSAQTPPAQPVLTDADMPPIESLNEESDYNLFLSAGVSEALRRQALRKLFTLPSVNRRDPLDSEYYDCHGFEPLGNVVTHEMKEELEREAQKRAQELKTAMAQDIAHAVDGSAPDVAVPPPVMHSPAVTDNMPRIPRGESTMKTKRKLVKRRRA